MVYGIQVLHCGEGTHRNVVVCCILADGAYQGNTQHGQHERQTNPCKNIQAFSKHGLKRSVNIHPTINPAGGSPASAAALRPPRFTRCDSYMVLLWLHVMDTCHGVKPRGTLISVEHSAMRAGLFKLWHGSNAAAHLPLPL